MKIGLFYLFSEFGNVPQDRIFGEVLDESVSTKIHEERTLS